MHAWMNNNNSIKTVTKYTTVYEVYLVVILIWWFAKFKSRHFNSHTRNKLIYLPFRQIKMMPTLFLNKSPNIQLANKSTYTVIIMTINE